eukprot:845208-Rhodomonas_salina.2
MLDDTFPTRSSMSGPAGEPFTDRKSTFQAHLASVESLQDVESMVRVLKVSALALSMIRVLAGWRLGVLLDIKLGSALIVFDWFSWHPAHNHHSRFCFTPTVCAFAVVCPPRWLFSERCVSSACCCGERAGNTQKKPRHGSSSRSCVSWLALCRRM